MSYVTPPGVLPPPPPAGNTKPTNPVLIGLAACGAGFVFLLVIGLIAAALSSPRKAETVSSAPASVPTYLPSTTVSRATTTTTTPPTTAPPTTAPPTTSGPVETAGQRNARKSAQHYLETMPFSRAGLIHQLTSPYGAGFSNEDAVYGVDSLNADWNAQAVRSAKHYLETMPFSRDGLIRQLSSPYGGQFTHEEAVYGVDGAGL